MSKEDFILRGSASDSHAMMVVGADVGEDSFPEGEIIKVGSLSPQGVTAVLHECDLDAVYAGVQADQPTHEVDTAAA